MPFHRGGQHPAQDEAPWVGLRPVTPAVPGVTSHLAPLIEADSADELLDELATGRAALLVIDRRRRGWHWIGPWRLTNVLASAGYVVDNTWLVAPSVATPRRIVPLDHLGALRWYAQSLFVPGSWATALAFTSIRVVLRFAGLRAVAAVAPAYAMTVRRTGDRLTHPGALEPLMTGSSAAETTKALVLGSGNDAGSRIVLLTFDVGSSEPAGVVKISTMDPVASDTAAEHTRLIELQTELGGALAGTVPRPIWMTEWCGRTWTAQSAAPGESIERSSGSIVARWGRAIRDLERTARWTTDFATATGEGTLAWDDVTADRWLFAPLDHLLADHPIDQARQVVARLRGCSAALAGAPLPLVGQHFDLAPCNVFTSRDHLTVLDWERSGERPAAGLPGRDLLFFASYWLFLVRGADTAGTRARCLRDLLAGDCRDRYQRAVARVVSTSFDELGVDRRFLPLLYASLWTERAEHHAARASALGGSATVPAPEVEASLAYLALLATSR